MVISLSSPGAQGCSQGSGGVYPMVYPVNEMEASRHPLVEARRLRGWSQDRLAALLQARGLGTTKKTIRRWERGVIPDSAAQTARRCHPGQRRAPAQQPHTTQRPVAVCRSSPAPTWRFDQEHFHRFPGRPTCSRCRGGRSARYRAGCGTAASPAATRHPIYSHECRLQPPGVLSLQRYPPSLFGG